MLRKLTQTISKLANTPRKRKALLASALPLILAAYQRNHDLEYNGQELSLLFMLFALAGAALLLYALTPLEEWVHGDRRGRVASRSEFNTALAVFERKLETWPPEDAARAARLVKQALDGETIGEPQLTELTLEQVGAIREFLKAVILEK